VLIFGTPHIASAPVVASPQRTQRTQREGGGSPRRSLPPWFPLTRAFRGCHRSPPGRAIDSRGLPENQKFPSPSVFSVPSVVPRNQPRRSPSVPVHPRNQRNPASHPTPLPPSAPVVASPQRTPRAQREGGENLRSAASPSFSISHLPPCPQCPLWYLGSNPAVAHRFPPIHGINGTPPATPSLPFPRPPWLLHHRGHREHRGKGEDCFRRSLLWKGREIHTPAATRVLTAEGPGPRRGKPGYDMRAAWRKSRRG